MLQSKFERRLMRKYFRNTDNECPALCVKLFSDIDKCGDEGSECNNSLTHKCTGESTRRRALSPKLQAVYFGVKNEAFFDKRQGILRPDIKLKIVEMWVAAKSKRDSGRIAFSNKIVINRAGNTGDRVTSCTTLNANQVELGKLSPPITPWLSGLAKEFACIPNKETLLSNKESSKIQNGNIENCITIKLLHLIL